VIIKHCQHLIDLVHSQGVLGSTFEFANETRADSADIGQRSLTSPMFASQCSHSGRYNLMSIFGGILHREKIPGDFELSDTQSRQVAAHHSGVPHIDREAIRRFLKRLNYPLYFLDFETIFPAIPLFDRSKPYGQIPFQFSLHVKTTPAAEPQHYGFLADGHGDPRPAFLSELKRLLGENGSIVGYNTNFEVSRLRECAGFFPEYQSWLTKNVPKYESNCRPTAGRTRRR